MTFSFTKTVFFGTLFMIVFASFCCLVDLLVHLVESFIDYDAPSAPCLAINLGNEFYFMLVKKNSIIFKDFFGYFKILKNYFYVHTKSISRKYSKILLIRHRLSLYYCFLKF